MEELKKETAIQRISKMALISDFTVVGIGGVDTNATIIKNSILTPDDYLLLKKQGAVGDILSHFIDINGNLIDTDLEKRLMSRHSRTSKNITTLSAWQVVRTRLKQFMLY